MTSKKSLLVLGAAVATVSLAGVGIASAATSTTSGNTIVDKLATKFHLNKSDVQGVFDQNRQEHQAEHEKKYEERLATAVTDGKITAAQKSQILAKHKELMATMQDLKDKTPTERRAAMEKQRTDIQAWEKTNNIPAEYLGGLGMGYGHGRRGGMHFDGAAHDDTPSADAPATN